jgi:hypothetical protein
MSLLVDIIGSGVGGGVLGVAGAVVNKWLDLKTLDKKTAAELAKLELDYSHKEKLASLTLSEKDYEALSNSINSDKATYSEGFTGEDGKLLRLADFIRGVVRPGLTVYLVFFNSALLTYLVYKYDLAFTKEQAYELAQAILTCILGCTSLALGWWFGARKIN